MNRILVTGDMNISGFTRALQTLGNQKESWTVSESEFNAWQTDILNPNSTFYSNPPNVLMVVLSPRVLERGESLYNEIKSCLDTLAERNGICKVLFSNLVCDPIGPQPFFLAVEQQHLAEKINALLRAFQLDHLWFEVLDFVSFVTLHGLNQITDTRFEALGRMFLSPKGAQLFAESSFRYLRATRVPSKKVLVLDLDNTLWGGIIGEDGCEGIQLGGEGSGYGFLRFQKALAWMKNNGILLAICSKNNEDEVLKVFQTHHDFALRMRDFVAHRINWDPKVANLKSLAEELSLGLDSFVFFDDSAHECESVRRELPMVDVIQLPPDSTEFVRYLYQYVGFDIFRVTKEDRNRSMQYLGEAQRKTIMRQSSNLEDFYTSLNMVALFSTANEKNLTRVHQLIHKTNQFNLTSQRIDEAAVRARLLNPDYWIITLTLSDRLGESGLTGLALVLKKERDWYIENLMMSCRIIGRTVEFAFMRFIVNNAEREGATAVHAQFIPSPRNQVANGYLARCGFTATGSEWVLNIKSDKNKIPKDYVTINSAGGYRNG